MRGFVMMNLVNATVITEQFLEEAIVKDSIVKK